MVCPNLGDGAGSGLLSSHSSLEGDWELGLAADLSQLGVITLADDTRQKLADGLELDAQEQEMYAGHPEAGYDLLSRIPRLENVALMVRHQGNPPADLDARVTLGALMLGVAAAYDRQIVQGRSHGQAVAGLEIDHLDAESLIERLGASSGPAVSWDQAYRSPNDVHPGMVLDQDLRAASGLLLIRKGEWITPPLLVRIRSYARRGGLEHDQVKVKIPGAGT